MNCRDDLRKFFYQKKFHNLTGALGNMFVGSIKYKPHSEAK